jgi:PhnB protein
MAKKKKIAKKATKKAVKRAAPKRKKAAAKAKPVRAKPAAAKLAAAPVEGGITPYLCCKGGAAALDFYAKAFGAVETLRIQGKDGSIGHAGITIEGSPLMVSDEWPDGGVFSPQTLGGTPVTVHMYVKNVDALVARAGKAGATVVRAPQDEPYGDRSATLRDPFGHRWMVATKKEDVSKQEMEARFGGAYLVT